MHRLGGAVRLLCLPGFGGEVEGLDDDGEGDRAVDESLVDVDVEALGDEGGADEDEEGEGEHLHSGVFFDEAADDPGGEEHDDDRENYSGDHDVKLIHHADGGDDGVEGEDDIEKEYLHDDGTEGRGFDRGGMGFWSFESFVDLDDGFVDQEQSADDEDEVAAAELECSVAESKEWCCEADDKRGDEEQPNAHEERERETEDSCALSLLGGEFAGEDGDEDDVVDPEYQLKDEQSEERDP